MYFLCKDGARIAELSDPQSSDMFWWDYRVEPTSLAGEAMIREPQLWEETEFTIVDEDGNEPNPQTFSGEYGLFCQGLTDRISFRSLAPISSPAVSAGFGNWYWWCVGIAMGGMLSWMYFG